MTEEKNGLEVAGPLASFNKALPRRSFLKAAGLSAAAMAVLAACSKTNTNPTPVGGNGLSFGVGDTAILNFAYALEQLEAAFYTKVNGSFYTGATDEEKLYLSDIMKHEIIHREFFKAAIGTSALPALMVDFSSINFADRTSVLTTAQAFEDLGVQAYNGAAKYIQSPDYLTLAGKIVSVEARHAAYIRDLVKAGSFADSTILTSSGLDKDMKPQAVLAIASKYITTKLDASTLPNS